MEYKYVMLNLPNGIQVKLPINLPLTPRGSKHKDAYQDFLQGNINLVRRHLTAVTTILPRYIFSDVKRVLHVFGGVGAMAQVITQIWPSSHQEMWERDATLVEYLNQAYAGTYDIVSTADSTQLLLDMPVEELATFDMVCLDASLQTIKSPWVKRSWEKLNAANVKYVWFTDTACAKIHLNYQSYERDFSAALHPTAEAYLEAYDTWLTRDTKFCIIDAMREAGSIYALASSFETGVFPIPIPYM